MRSRPVAGDMIFMTIVADEIHKIISKKRDATKITHDVAEMRALIAQEKGDRDPWDLKLARGGLMDIEFIAQTLVLIHAHASKSMQQHNTAAILMAARDLGLVDPDEAHCLLEGYALMRDLMQWQRAMVSGEFEPSKADRSFLKRLANMVGLPDFRLLDLHLREVQEKVHKIFEAKILP